MSVGMRVLHGAERDIFIISFICGALDRLCGLVVRVPGCKPRGRGFHSRRYRIFCIAIGLERGPLSLVRKKVERKVAARSRKLRLTVVGDALR
jgi:hypothetical protein